jgi:hypothetical protein
MLVNKSQVVVALSDLTAPPGAPVVGAGRLQQLQYQTFHLGYFPWL